MWILYGIDLAWSFGFAAMSVGTLKLWESDAGCCVTSAVAVVCSTALNQEWLALNCTCSDACKTWAPSAQGGVPGFVDVIINCWTFQTIMNIPCTSQGHFVACIMPTCLTGSTASSQASVWVMTSTTGSGSLLNAHLCGATSMWHSLAVIICIVQTWKPRCGVA